MKILLPITILATFFVACDQTGNVSGKKPAADTVAIAAATPTAITATVTTTTTTAAELPELNEDVITDTMAFPTYGDTAFPGKLLTTGRFHGDEVEDDAPGLAWFGVFRTAEGGYYIDTARVMARHVEDIGDEAGSKPTGWEVTTANKDTSIVLISGFKYLAKHKIESVTPDRNQLVPGDTMAFLYKGAHYRLYATGLVKGDEYYNYKLYLTADKKGRRITQLLLAQPLSGRDNFPIFFIGDIDGDHFPDLMLDAASHENVEMPTLYLSKPADRNQLLLIAGKQNRVGC